MTSNEHNSHRLAFYAGFAATYLPFLYFVVPLDLELWRVMTIGVVFAIAYTFVYHAVLDR